MSTQEFYECVQELWSIESQLHWSLYVVFHWDACRTSVNHASENPNVLRKVALSLLRSARNLHEKGNKKLSSPKNISPPS